MEETDLLVQFIRENQACFYRVAYSYVKESQTAMDLVQDAIVKALQKYHTIKDAQLLRPWFYRILVNECLSYLRKNRRNWNLIALEDQPEVAAETHRSEEYLDLYDAIDGLDPQLRTIIILHYFEGLTLEEVAEITKTNLNTVKTRMYRALRYLRGKIDGGEEYGSYTLSKS